MSKSQPGGGGGLVLACFWAASQALLYRSGSLAPSQGHDCALGRTQWFLRGPACIGGVLWPTGEEKGDFPGVTQRDGGLGAGTQASQRLLGHCFHMVYHSLVVSKDEKQNFLFLWGQCKKWKHFEVA